jgi:hypothetical protein
METHNFDASIEDAVLNTPWTFGALADRLALTAGMGNEKWVRRTGRYYRIKPGKRFRREGS